jgi:hypothetical protein
VAVGEDAVGPHVNAVRTVCECIKLASLAMASREPAADFVEGARSLEDWRRDFEVWESSAKTVYADFKA